MCAQVHAGKRVMYSLLQRFSRDLLWAAAALSMLSGAAGRADAAVAVQLSPAAAKLVSGQNMGFLALLSGTNDTRVIWKVNGVTGGSAATGTISSAGSYTAPAQISSVVTITVAAQSVADPTQSGTAWITVAPAITVTPVAVSVSPASASLAAGQTRQFSATVTGTANTTVAWQVNGQPGGSPAVGIVSSTGAYTAPTVIASASSVTVTATSIADTSKSSSARVALAAAAQPLNLVPSSVNLPAGGSQQFTASIGGVPTTAVRWSLSAQSGTISSSGLYAAPASIASAQTVTVTATSTQTNATANSVVGLAPGAAPLSGGLVAVPTPAVSANLLVNPGFEQGKTGWTDNGFTIDTTVSHSGAASLRVVNPNLIPYAQSASQTLALKMGVYNFGAWIKVSALAATTGQGVRLCLGAPVSFPHTLTNACTNVVKGTADWQYVESTSIALPQDSNAAVLIDAYGDPDGTAWIDDVTVTRSQFPVQSFLLYPNYRGLLFDDQPQIARFNVTVDPPAGTLLTDYHVNQVVTDEVTGAVVSSNSYTPEASMNLTADFTSLLSGRPYRVTFALQKSGYTYTYPAYRIIRTPASARASMAVSFDAQNRFLLHGRPAFLLGVYDSGMGYAADEATWTNLFTTSRRLFELPINFYLNYWYGGAANASMLPMMNVLGGHGIYNLTNANCFSHNTVEQMGGSWFTSSTDAVIQQRAAHPYFGGFYAADECIPSLVPDVFGHTLDMKRLDPGGANLGVMLPDANVPQWRDAVDILATDPYPMYGAEPATGYPFVQVADGAAATQRALLGSRPFATVIQFFQFTSNSRWPTQTELRNMSYEAIVGGANGLFYWSLGAGALAYICDGSDAAHSPAGSASWCQAKVDEFTALKNTLIELKSMEPVLLLNDRPDLLTASSNTAIRTRVKYDGTTTYVIAYNASSTPQTATFGFGRVTAPVTVMQEARTVAPSSNSFTDTFLPNGVHVYAVR